MEWRDGAQHRILFDTEIRIPIEPSLLWLVVFLDGGALYEQTNRAVGTKKDYFESYDKNKADQIAANPIGWYIQNNFNLQNGRKADVTYDELNNPGRLILSSDNVAMDRMRYSWGVGLRVQIPVLPLRIYFAQKLKPTGNFWAPFERYESDNAFQFVFGIGDYRF